MLIVSIPCGSPLSRIPPPKKGKENWLYLAVSHFAFTYRRSRFHAPTLFCPMIYVYTPKSEYLHLILGLRMTVVISYFVWADHHHPVSFLSLFHRLWSADNFCYRFSSKYYVLKVISQNFLSTVTIFIKALKKLT